MAIGLSEIGTTIDISGFNRIFGEFQQRFIRFAVSYIADRAVAEDIVMESFVAAWERRDQLTLESFPAYTLRIVRNKCLNHLRALGVRQRVNDELHTHGTRMLDMRISTLEACDPEELFSQEARKLVNRTLDTLPSRTREIFIRSRFAGESYKEIAAALGITPKSVEFEISKAMKELRVALKDYLPFFLFWFYIH